MENMAAVAPYSGRKLTLRIDDHSDAGTVALQKPPPPAESYSPSNLWIATQSRCGTQVKKPFISTESTSRASRSEEHTSELQSPCNLVCRLLLEKKNNIT